MYTVVIAIEKRSGCCFTKKKKKKLKYSNILALNLYLNSNYNFKVFRKM